MIGRMLQERAGQEPQIPFTMPLLIGTDGVHKMSQSLGNYVAIDDAPDDMFGKLMSIPDEQIVPYFELCTDVPAGEVVDLAEGLRLETLHPGDTKRRLARMIVDIYHGPGSGTVAERAFNQVFRDHRPPEDVPEFTLPPGDPIHLPAVLKRAGLVASSSEARRLIGQGAVKLDGELVREVDVPRELAAGSTVQVGKRRFVTLLG
jgi:tyrosyl-tRNA synthetase